MTEPGDRTADETPQAQQVVPVDPAQVENAPTTGEQDGGENEDGAEKRRDKRQTFVFSMIGIIVTALLTLGSNQLGAHQNRDAADLAASRQEALADKSFRRGEQKTTYADFLTSLRAADDAVQAAATALLNVSNGAPPATLPDVLKKMDGAISDVVYKLDLVNFVASKDTYDLADGMVGVIQDEADVVYGARNQLEERPLNAEEQRNLIKGIYQTPLPDQMDAFTVAGRKDLDVYGQA